MMRIWGTSAIGGVVGDCMSWMSPLGKGTGRILRSHAVHHLRGIADLGSAKITHRRMLFRVFISILSAEREYASVPILAFLGRRYGYGNAGHLQMGFLQKSELHLPDVPDANPLGTSAAAATSHHNHIWMTSLRYWHDTRCPTRNDGLLAVARFIKNTISFPL